MSGSCCNLHKATHFLISSTTSMPSSSTSVNIATLQVLPKKQNKNHFCSLSLSLSYACTHAHTHIYLQSQTHSPQSTHTHTHAHTEGIRQSICHVSGKTSVLAVRCCCFVTNNNGHPSLTHTSVHAIPQQSHMTCSDTSTLGDPLTDSLSFSHATSYACHNRDISFSSLL